MLFFYPWRLSHGRFYIPRFLRIGSFIGIAAYIIIDVVIDHPENLSSILGVVIFILIFYVTSTNPARVVLLKIKRPICFITTYMLRHIITSYVYILINILKITWLQTEKNNFKFAVVTLYTAIFRVKIESVKRFVLD